MTREVLLVRGMVLNTVRNPCGDVRLFLKEIDVKPLHDT